MTQVVNSAAKDEHNLVAATVNHVLAVASKQHIIKQSEIVKNCLRGDRTFFHRVMPQALNILECVGIRRENHAYKK